MELEPDPHLQRDPSSSNKHNLLQIIMIAEPPNPPYTLAAMKSIISSLGPYKLHKQETETVLVWSSLV